MDAMAYKGSKGAKERNEERAERERERIGPKKKEEKSLKRDKEQEHLL